MTDPNLLQSQPTTLASLNRTPLSAHVRTLFDKQKATPAQGLLLTALVWWQAENPGERDATWLREAAIALDAAAASEPARVYEFLADDSLLQTQTLQEAADLLLPQVVALLE